MSEIILGSNEAFEKILKKNKYCVCDFSATWCGPCRMIAPIFEELADDYKNITFINIDVDKFQELSAKFNIDAVPTIIILKNGNPINRISGYMPKEQLESFIINNCKES